MIAAASPDRIARLLDEVERPALEQGSDEHAENAFLRPRHRSRGIAPSEGGERMIPEGWKLVPVEPTPAMTAAFSVASAELTKRHLLGGSYPATWQPIEAGYAAMLAAAPTPPVQQDKPDMWLRQTSSERNPPHGWAVHFIPKDGDIPMFLKAQAPTPPVQQDDEAERLRAALTKANNQAEHFEREWYLRGDEIERLRSGRNELEAAISNALPGVRYMDPPDGGSPSLAEQLRRMATDAERYRWLRGDSCMDHSARWTQWEVRRWDAPIWTNDLRRADLDAAIDDAMRKEPDHAR